MTFPRFALAAVTLSMLAACGGGGDGGEVTPPPPPPEPSPQVTLTVSNGADVSGQIVLTLNNAAPATVANFLNYVNSGFYTNTIFHRNAPGFVLQAGGYAAPVSVGPVLPTPKPTNGPIVLEDNVGLSNLRYTVAMARTNAPDSATSQFFINMADNTFLDRNGSARGYAVFGTVTAGIDVVNAIATAACRPWPAFLPSATDCLPGPNVVITSATRTR